MLKKTILIIDKELEDYQKLIDRLDEYQYVVHTSSCYHEGLLGLIQLKIDLIIISYHLFLLLEKEMTEKVNGWLGSIPMIIIGTSKKEEEVLNAFNKGAADYLIKPISIREIEARMKAILRRIEIAKITPPEPTSRRILILDADSFEIDLLTHKVSLSRRELQLLLFIIQKKVISREEVITFIWGDDNRGSRIVDVHISKLRRKIELDPKNPQYIKTIKGFGYRFDGKLEVI